MIKNELSERLKEKVLAMPEYRQGVNKVKIILKDGTVYNDVYIAWGYEIVKIGNSFVIPFNANDIVDVENEV